MTACPFLAYTTPPVIIGSIIGLETKARPTLNYDLLVGTFGGDLDLPGLAQRGYVLEVTYSR